MPATIKTASHEADTITNIKGVDYAEEALNSINHPRRHVELLQSSLDNDQIPPVLLARKNGFINAVTTAYGRHHHLVIRPDDIWLAVISQFSAYVQKHAEELRGSFVSHEGQKDLKIEYNNGDRYSVDFADFALKISDLIAQNVVDGDIRTWITPDFSTTTQNDVVVASIMMMGTLQSYFRYHASIACGIPSVTLLGTVEDYEQILRRIDKLELYGEEPVAFSHLLRPVIKYFIRSFHEPDHAKVQEFWRKICDISHGSGFTHYTGWITAFAFWNSKGNRQVHSAGQCHCQRMPRWLGAGMDACLDGLHYGSLDLKEIPDGFTKVPVCVDDNGDEFKAEMLAGSIGITCTSSGKTSANGSMGLDTMQPHLAWFMYEVAEDSTVDTTTPVSHDYDSGFGGFVLELF